MRAMEKQGYITEDTSKTRERNEEGYWADIMERGREA